MKAKDVKRIVDGEELLLVVVNEQVQRKRTSSRYRNGHLKLVEDSDYASNRRHHLAHQERHG